jgi:DNA-binding beta-propeller fold protein YncE
LATPSELALDRQGDVYVADTYNSRIQKFSPAGKLLARFGVYGIHNGEFAGPQSIAVDAHGNMYVGDVIARIQKLSPKGKVLAVFSPPSLSDPQGLALDAHGDLFVADSSAKDVLELSPTGQVLHQYGNTPGANPNDPGQFSYPAAVAVGSDGSFYVADAFSDRVQKIDPSGKAVAWGTYGYGRGQYFLPQGIALDRAGNLYVADTNNSRIQKLSSSDGRVLAVWGKYATVPQVLGRPGALAVDPHGDLWVTDTLNDRVQVRSTQTGHVLAVFGYHGFLAEEQGTKGLGQFDAPLGIAIDKRGEVYVADTTNCRVEELAPRGPIGAFGSFGHDPGTFEVDDDVALGPQGKIYVADTYNSRIQVFAHAGKDQHQLLQVIDLKPVVAKLGSVFFPERIAVDHEGNIYVDSHTFDDRILKLSPSGDLIATFGQMTGSVGDPTDRFYGPNGLFIDRQDHLWVADTSHGIIQELSTSGKTLTQFTEPGLSPSPSAVTVDAHGYVYVADYANSLLFKFSPRGKVVARWR